MPYTMKRGKLHEVQWRHEGDYYSFQTDNEELAVWVRDEISAGHHISVTMQLPVSKRAGQYEGYCSCGCEQPIGEPQRLPAFLQPEICKIGDEIREAVRNEER